MLRRMTGKGLSTRNLLGGGDDKKGGKNNKKDSPQMSDEQLEKAYGLKDLTNGQKVKVHHLIELLEAIRLCNKAKSLEEAIGIIIDSTCQILLCDRGTLFMVDELTDELVIRHAVGTEGEDIRIPSNTGIAGAVYQAGAKLNIADPYNDARFNKETDKKTGYKTESILCSPIFDAAGDCVAVLQAINKKGGKFNEDDEMVMDHLAMQVGVVLSNQLLSERTKRTHGQVISLLEIVKSLHSNMGINSLMFTITEKSPALVDADRCTLYLVDRARNELWSLQGAIEVRVPMDKGLIGACATAGEIINIKDAWEDSRFNKDFDKQTGYRTRSVLCMPIRDNPQDGSPPLLVGVLQLINKLAAPQFLSEDEQLLQSFVDIAGTILSASQLFQSVKKKETEFGAAADLMHPAALASKEPMDRRSMKKMGSKATMMKSFREEAEDAEEEE